MRATTSILCGNTPLRLHSAVQHDHSRHTDSFDLAITKLPSTSHTLFTLGSQANWAAQASWQEGLQPGRWRA